MASRGKGSRQKGNAYERKIAHIICDFFDLLYEENPRTPRSGGGQTIPGDIMKSQELKSMFPFHVECKNQKQLRLMQWIDQAKDDCPSDETPIVVFHRENTSEEYVVIDLRAFLDLCLELTGQSEETNP